MISCRSCKLKCGCGGVFYRHTIRTFKIVQLVRATTEIGLFAQDDGRLEGIQVDFLATVKVTTDSSGRHDGPRVSGKCLDSDDVNDDEDTFEIIPVYLDGGRYEPMESSLNFAGIWKPGLDPYQCIGDLHPDDNEAFFASVKSKGLWP